MESFQNNSFFNNTNKSKQLIITIILLSICFTLVPFLLFFLCPNFLNKNDHSCFLNVAIHDLQSIDKAIWQKAIIVVFFFLCILELPLIFLSNFPLWRGTLLYITFNKWYSFELNKQAQIINSCNDFKNWHDKVAMLVPIYNDFVPKTILQTAKQTYPNIDVWISDDSSKIEVQKEINAFCKLHHFNLIRRDVKNKKEHPTKIGNIYNFVAKYGDKYDYIFENDSSSIITPNFVSNALCYFKSPLVDNSKVAAVIANGSFYGCKNIIGYMQTKSTQFGETFFVGSSLSYLTNSTLLNGWGCLYKVSLLKEIPLDKIECTICDAARAIAWSQDKKIVLVDHYSFSSKFAPQTVVGFKQQKLKWRAGDIFVYSKLLTHQKNKGLDAFSFFIKSFSLLVVRVLPIYYFFIIVKSIFVHFLFRIDNKLALINLSSILITTAFWVIVALIILFFMCYYKSSIKKMFFVFFSSFLDFSIYHHMVLFTFCQILFGKKNKNFLKLATTNVTNKTSKVDKFNFHRFLVDCWLSLLVIFLTTLLTIGLICYWWINDKNNAVSIIPLTIGLYFFINMPLFVYIFLYFGTWMKVKIGYDNSDDEYHFEKYDFRYEIVSKTKLWQKQNSKKSSK